MFSQSHPKIVIWSMDEGKPEELEINGTHLHIKHNISNTINPIEVAKTFIESSKTFLDVFDVEISIVSNQQNTTSKETVRTKRKYNKSLDISEISIDRGEPISRMNNIGVYQQRIDAMLESFPPIFSADDIDGYLMKVYEGQSTFSIKNKRAAYMKYFRQNKLIVFVRKEGKTNKFKFNPAIETKKQDESTNMKVQL